MAWRCAAWRLWLHTSWDEFQEYKSDIIAIESGVFQSVNISDRCNVAQSTKHKVQRKTYNVQPVHSRE